MRETCDPSLISKVREYGVFNEHGCFNCGSCTIACDLATPSNAFPRRTLQSVVLGLRDSVHRSLDAWLCHDCGDCSINCPREAGPRESMMTLRRYLSAQYDWTGLARRFGRSTGWEVVALSCVAVLLLTVIILYHVYIEGVDVPTLRSTSLGLEHMFPRVVYLTLAAYLIPAFFFASHAGRMLVYTMCSGPGAAVPLRVYLAEAKAFILHTVASTQILRCRATTINRRRWIVMHALIASGSVLMFVIKFFFLKWFQTDQIYRFYHPQRWLGYIGAASLILGSLAILIEQARKKKPGQGEFKLKDPLLPALLLLTGLSGLVAHVLRYMGFALGAHYAFGVHLLIAIPMLLVEVPFGKSSHVIYRPLALFFAAVRERSLQGQAAGQRKAA